MATYTVGEICDAIATTLSTTTGLVRTQSYNELTEGMQDWPTLQVYPERWEVTVGSETDRYTFVDASTSVPRRDTEITFHLDLICRRRSQLAEDWEDVVTLASALDAKLCEEGPCPHLGSSAIQSFHWTAQRVVFEYGADAQGRPLRYPGFRFTLTVRVF